MLLGMPQPIMGKSKASPFSLGGTFSADMDGWASATFTRFTGFPRTSPGTLQSSSTAGVADYVLSADQVRGLTITAGIWHRMSSPIANDRSLQYRIGAGSFVTLATINNSSTTYGQLSGSFENPGNDEVTIRLSVPAGNGVYFDDWEISGA